MMQPLMRRICGRPLRSWSVGLSRATILCWHNLFKQLALELVADPEAFMPLLGKMRMRSGPCWAYLDALPSSGAGPGFP